MKSINNLDSQSAQLLEASKKAGLRPVFELPMEEARKQMATALSAKSNPVPIHAVTGHAIGETHQLRLRVYRINEADDNAGLIFFHGGGWCLNSLETHDQLCRELASTAGINVVSVDYRLAPESKFPAQIEDAALATRWIMLNSKSLGLNSSRIGIGGDSSGGTQAAVVSSNQEAFGLKKRLAFQVLFYPATAYIDETRPSYIDSGTGFSLSTEFMKWAWKNYLPDDFDPHDPFISPLCKADLSECPPTFVATAECDPLRSEGEAFAQALEKSGVEVKMIPYPGVMHGFVIQFWRLDAGRKCLQDAIDFISDEIRKL